LVVPNIVRVCSTFMCVERAAVFEAFALCVCVCVCVCVCLCSVQVLLGNIDENIVYLCEHIRRDSGLGQFAGWF
jgi:hypothetical protein